MQKLRKLIIMDDDPHYSGMLALKLRMQFPELAVSSYNKTNVPSGYDIYILDNDFLGERCGATLAETVRKVAPESLVLVLSGTLEFSLLKRLVNCHAAGVFDKGRDTDLEQMTALIEHYLLKTSTKNQVSSDASSSSLLGNITALISEWNKRLKFEERKAS